MTREQLTQEQLIEIVHRFYPRLDPDEYAPADFDHALWTSPEYRAMSKVQEQAWERIEQFRALVTAVRRALPPGSYAVDHTYPERDAAYEAVFGFPRDDSALVSKTLVLQVSYLIPYYICYERHSYRDDPDGTRWRNEPPRYEITPEMAPILALIEREVATHYGYERFPSELVDVQVPGVFVDGAYLDVPTLGVALFAPARW